MTVQDVHERDIATGSPKVVHASELQERSPAELMALYLGAARPTSVRDLGHDPRGVPVRLHRFADGRLERWILRTADRGRFVWHGKSFRPESDQKGWGFNRLAIGPFLEVLPFRVTIAPSVFDGAPCIGLDYATARNPRLLRRTWDELREVWPGVFLGPVTLRLFGRHLVVAWFAIDTTGPDSSIGA